MKKPNKQTRTNQSGKLRGVLEILLVIGLILLIPLFFAIRTQANSQVVNNTPIPFMTFTAAPGATRVPGGIAVSTSTPVPPTQPPKPSITAKEPLACAFPLAQTTTAETAPENYTFSEPRVVPLDPSWNTISIFQWLPDNQRILIAHTDDTQTRNVQQTIGLLNPQTGDVQDFGSRFAPASARPPVWISGMNAIVYPELRRLWLSRGDPAHAQPIVDEPVTIHYDHPLQFGEQLIEAAGPDGNQIVYLDSVGKQLYEQKVVQGSLESLPSPSFDATQWTYRKPDNSVEQNWWNMTWRPNSTQVFLYSDPVAFGFSYTFLLDIQSGRICELSLWKDDPSDWRKSWLEIAHWSPNGRYLAVLRSKGLAPTDFSDLIVLDTATGRLFQIEPTKLSPAGLEMQGKHYFSDVTWAPDNRHLAAIGQVDYYSSNGNFEIKDELFLLDFQSGQTVPISSAEFGPNMNWPNDTLLWSNDGSQLAELCPGGLCLLPVQKHAQP
jgi:hypothetical protein